MRSLSDCAATAADAYCLRAREISQRVRKKKRKSPNSKSSTDPVEAAEEAGLRYVSDDQPGYTRKRKRRRFRIFRHGRKTDPRRDSAFCASSVSRFRRLTRDVWICPSPNGHIQATGRDARGRKQYRYHERWREVRDENKYETMLVFGEALAENSPAGEERHGAAGSAARKSARDGRQLLETHFHSRRQRRICARKQIVWPNDHAEPACRRERREGQFQFSRQERRHARSSTSTIRALAKVIRKLPTCPGRNLSVHG